MQRYLSFWKFWVGGLVLLGIVIGATGYHPQAAVVTFDKKAVIKQFVTQLSHQNLEEKKTQELSNRFAKILRETLENYAKTHHVIVIKKEMTLASNEDITPLIATRLANNMRVKR